MVSENVLPKAAQLLEDLRRKGHVKHANARLTALSGGVSSEIYLVEDGAQKFVVKRALAKLRVKDDWFADVSRNESEWRYIRFAAGLLPGVVPRLRFTEPESGYFGMEYLGGDFANWKELLLAGNCREKHARLAGRILGQIHRLTAGNESLRKEFDTTRNFYQLRLEPYLVATAARHPDLRTIFLAEARRIENTRTALVHGDFSPKNILIRGNRMVVLDCEVAWYGDPAFDAAFLLNHLFLKMLAHAPRELGIEKMIAGFWREYLICSGEPGEEFQSQVLRLLPMLMLARVDGKSPVEYLDGTRRPLVRNFASAQLRRGEVALEAFLAAWRAECRLIRRRVSRDRPEES
jgi:aminoglycoside phosphotransferase (APT) family kinase protein